MNHAFDPCRKRILEAKTLTVLTGAGVSAESGIPTFRDRNGVWAQYDPAKVATREAFLKNPKYVWEWYILRMRSFQKAQPNPAHLALARLEKATPKFTLITQNIDNLHRAAGSQNVIELHGNLWRMKCVGCHKKVPIEKIPDRVPPECAACGYMLRPDVVWFGEMLDPKNTAAAEAALDAEVVVVVGTSGEVWPAAGYAQEASQRGAYVIEINVGPTALSGVVDASLFGKAGNVLAKLVP